MKYDWALEGAVPHPQEWINGPNARASHLSDSSLPPGAFLLCPPGAVFLLPPKTLRFNEARIGLSANTVSGPETASTTGAVPVVTCAGPADPLSISIPGILVDDGSMYSCLGAHEMTAFCDGDQWRSRLDPLPLAIAHTPFWTYGPPGHASEPRAILDSIMLAVDSSRGGVLKSAIGSWPEQPNVVLGNNLLEFAKVLNLANTIESSDGSLLPTYRTTNFAT